MKKILLTGCLSCLLLASCEKAFIDPDPINDPVANFESMWQTLDQRYAFFLHKKIDWDSIYQVYRPQVQEDMTEEELFDLLSGLLYELRDGHVNLFSPFDFSRFWLWYQDYPYDFNRTLLERNYWGTDVRYSGPLINTIIDSVGYLYYGSFASYIDPAQLDHVMARFKDLKGVIIDIRHNGGGSLSNAYRLASRFADTERTAYYTYYRNGPAHDDFQDPPFVTRIRPEGAFQYTGSVVVLTNRRCYSASNSFAQMMQVFPHVTLMGNTTGGGGGIPHYYELPNGWTYRFSVSQSFTPDGQNLEEGVPPDIPATLDPEKEAAGIDSILEMALEWLK